MPAPKENATIISDGAGGFLYQWGDNPMIWDEFQALFRGPHDAPQD